MAYNITYLNQIVADLGGSDTYIYEIDALNAICTLLGVTAGHKYKIDALNAIEVNQGGSGGHKYNIDALNSIITLAGETAGYTYEPLAWAAIQQGALLNQNEPEVEAYITGLTTPLSSTQIGKLNTFVAALKTGLGISALSDAFDVMYILAGETAESSLKNLVKNAHHATSVNSPDFTQFEGFNGNGTTSYINTNYNPVLDGSTVKINDICIGGYERINIISNEAFMGGYLSTDKSIQMYSLTTSGLKSRLNDGDLTSALLRPNSLGMCMSSRLLSIKKLYYNKTDSNDFNINPIDMPNISIHILSFNNNGNPAFLSKRQISFVFMGKHFVKSEKDNITDAFEAYMDSNGKGVIA